MTNPKAYLNKLQINYNILQEREAKYGGTAPLELINQVEDHKQAILLTKQALSGEISESQWREALSPLVSSLNRTQVIFDQHGQQVGTQYNAAGEINIGGDIRYHREISPSVPLQRPHRAPHFTNREMELQQLLTELQPGRVITLCGPGGIGKSALAAEAIWRLAPNDNPPERFPDGIISHNF